MRRKDREVTDKSRIFAVIDACPVVRLGLQETDGVYIVPLCFGYIENGAELSLYFHSAAVGKKIDLIRASKRVGFEMDTDCHIVLGKENACGGTVLYSSVIGSGTAVIVENAEEKLKGLQLIMQHLTHQSNSAFDQKMIDRTTVIRLDVDQISCKENQ